MSSILSFFINLISLSELKLIKGDTGARKIIQKNEKAINSYVTDDESYFHDLDTPEDFTNWMKRTIL